MKFLPFLLSFLDSHFLLPCPVNNLLTISSSEPQLSLDLTEAFLEGCYLLGNVHLCEQFGVLCKGLSNTCLGSLYAQKFKQSMFLMYHGCSTRLQMNSSTPQQLVSHLFHYCLHCLRQLSQQYFQWVSSQTRSKSGSAFPHLSAQIERPCAVCWHSAPCGILNPGNCMEFGGQSIFEEWSQQSHQHFRRNLCQRG